MNSEGFLGVRGDLLTRLGKLVVGASRVESIGHDIAYALGADPSNAQFNEVARMIRERLADDQDDIRLWVERAVTAMDQRNGLLHSVLHLRRTADDWLAERTRIRSATLQGDPTSELDSLVTRLHELVTPGHKLEQSLLPQPRKGVFVRKPRSLQDPTWIVIAFVETDAGGYWPTRATEAEMDEWWARYRPTWGDPPSV